MKKLYAIIILSLISIANAIYLTIASFKYKAWVWEALFCDINNTLSCTDLFSYDFSWFFGIPFAMIALFVYPIIIIIALAWIFNKIKNVFLILLIMAIWWMLFNSYIIINEFNVWVFCIACLICSISITTIAILSFIGLKDKKS